MKDMCRFPAMKKLREHDLQWMLEAKARAFRSLEEFYKVEANLASSRYGFDLKQVALLLPKIARLSTYEFEYARDDEEGYCCLQLRQTSLCELPVIASSRPMWWERYA